MTERDPARRLIDEAVVEAALDLREEDKQDLAIRFNNALVKAWPGG